MAGDQLGTRAFTAEQLCDARFLASLEHLRVVARRVARHGRFAEQRSRDLGAGIEFKDYRPYTPGDDLRALDWNVYRRLGRLFLRLFEELEDLPLYLLPDVSHSAFLESPPRALAGLRTALGLASISLGQHDRVGVFPFADDLKVLVRPTAGKSRILGMAQRLAELEPGGATDIARSLQTFTSLGLREGLVCVISDFFDPRGLEAVTEALARLRHRLLLVRLVRASDRDPTLSGDLRLVDCESRQVADVSITAHVLERYRAAYARFVEGLSVFALARGAGLLELDVEGDVLTQLERLFASGSYVA
jgi:uncharacterized protein (DUF58 family)